MKIIFISHDAARTGGSILLLNLIRLLKESGGYESTVVLRKGGVLEADFSAVAQTFTWNNPIQAQNKRKLTRRIAERVSGKRDQNREILEEVAKADVIINNTITNGELLERILKGYGGKVFSYIHELKIASLRFASPKGINLTIQLSDKLLFPSQSVKYYLETIYHINPGKLFPLSYYLESEKVNEIRTAGNNEKTLVIGACGTLDWRKGIDIFISVASYLKHLNVLDEFAFIWKGADSNREEYLRSMYDIENAGLKEAIQFLPADREMNPFYNSIDVFFLPSREDPYPLVVLEAASFSKPVICFQNAGGASEFVQEDAGDVVPYMDIAAVASTMLSYKNDPVMRREKGRVAKLRFHSLHENKSLILEQFKQIIDN